LKAFAFAARFSALSLTFAFQPSAGTSPGPVAGVADGIRGVVLPDAPGVVDAESRDLDLPDRESNEDMIIVKGPCHISLGKAD
jgi:hypothetical protein